MGVSENKRVPYFGVLIKGILLFSVLYEGPLFWETPILLLGQRWLKAAVFGKCCMRGVLRRGAQPQVQSEAAFLEHKPSFVAARSCDRHTHLCPRFGRDQFCLNPKP